MQAATSDGDVKKNKKVGPRPKQWSLSKIQEWLEDHPVLNPADISFLKREVASRKEILEAARKEEEEDNARLGAGNWNATACMRLIHALIDHDEIKAKFLNRLDLPAGRSAVENRAQIQATNVWHLMADKWNDKNFEPETASLPEVHSEFALSDIILHIEVANLTPATAEKVEDKWSSMILEMNRCIANWQKSGQGEGGIDDADNVSDREFGSLSNRSQHALATRETYFKDRQLYLLYLWCMLDKHALLGSALQKLNNSVSATNGAGGVPSVVRAVNKDADDGSASSSRSSTGNSTTIASLGKSIEKHGQSLVAVARMETQDREKERLRKEKSEIRGAIRELSREKRSLSLQYCSEMQKRNKFMADSIMEQMNDIQMDIEKHEVLLESMTETPKKTNRTPESGVEDNGSEK
jgi:hypothetical protein